MCKRRSSEYPVLICGCDGVKTGLGRLDVSEN